MKKLSLSVKLSLIISLFVLTCGMITFKALSGMEEVNQSLKFTNSTIIKRLKIAYELQGSFRLLVIEEKNLIVADSPEKITTFIGKIQTLSGKINSDLDGWLTFVSVTNRPRVESLKSILAQWVENDHKVAALMQAGKKIEATQLSATRAREIRLEFDKVSNETIEINATILKDFVTQSENSYHTSKITMVSLGVFATFLGVLIAFLVLSKLTRTVNSIISQLNENSAGLAFASSEIASASLELSQAATEQAASLQEISASIEEMNATVAKSAENAKTSSKLSTVSQSSALKGKEVVQQMIRSIEEIHLSNENMMKQITESNQQVSEIVRVISEIGNKTKVINDIVFQTKLLSFNASVEAARAGENGKGFAVVAEEVGTLAEMSGNAAKEISQMLDGSIRKVQEIVTSTGSRVEALMVKGREKVNAGAAVSRQCGVVLDEIVGNVSSLEQIVTEISQSCVEQSKGISEITKAMDQLNQVTQQNTTASEQTSSSAQNLLSESTRLKTVVELLAGAIKGSSHSSTAA